VDERPCLLQAVVGGNGRAPARPTKGAADGARIVARIRSAELGNLGDVRSVGEGISEMRIHSGPGYRLYFTQRGRLLIFLLVGGDKSSQRRDIIKAKALAKTIEE
jgi:putative addiction module killer protein